MEFYSKLAQSIVYSSLWSEDAETCKLWVTVIALKDMDGILRQNITGISRLTGISLEKCIASFSKFESPDPLSTSKMEDGRRLVRLESGGWRVVTHEIYQELGWSEEKKAQNRERVREFRKRKKESQTPTTVNSNQQSSTTATTPLPNDTDKKPEPKPARIFSEKLSTTRMAEKWHVWQTVRKAMKKPKNWDTLFNEQMEFLERYPEGVAFEILSSSIRNGYQGLFEPKNYENNGRNGQGGASKPIVPVRGSVAKDGF